MTSPGLSRALHLVPPAVAIALVAGLAAWQSAGPFAQGPYDLYPLYHGAQNLLDHGDAYRQDPAEPTGLGVIGNAYPLNAVLLVGLPLAAFPAVFAGFLYTVVVGVGWVASLRYARQSLAWLCWVPMWDALRIAQPTAIATVASIVAVGAAQRGHRWPFLVAICFMSIKPQQTIILLLYLIWVQRQWWREVLLTALSVLSITLLAQPTWVVGWVERVGIRSQVVSGELWLGLLLVPLALVGWQRGWRLSAAAVMSTGLAPWPIAGHYVAALWPIGMTWQHVAILCLGFGFAAFIEIPGLGYWDLPAVMILALAVAWLVPRHLSGDSSVSRLQPDLRTEQIERE